MNKSKQDFVQVTEKNHMAQVKMNRPDVRNAFHPMMLPRNHQNFSGLCLKKRFAGRSFKRGRQSFFRGR